jgi:predicted GIY-YIG superfamily endonuclease
MKKYYVYIMNSSTGTLYTGMTSNLKRRVYEHKQKLREGFTKKYNVRDFSPSLETCPEPGGWMTYRYSEG